ncbi:uncharacterized protein LOC116207159 [Punica granatum]|uniref:N-acetyltransferase domain-containing protein n=2 Tax=Punica granatum TaxID=22663 RepID=A0A218XB42_PUNGR|nr:uncharacterized protein LOC116207159 [Punica granatum]OWM82008.1 hypothetical protein CDL15_Pgr001581 [Punica granatum]PKI44754.1 hypothetical protein CRG98_034702 [Punica granatum]
MEIIDPARITLRPFELTDADDFFSWASDDRVIRNLRWTALASREQALTTVREVCIPHPWRRSICIDGRSIGFVSVFPWSGEDRCRADIGYALAPEYWGHGIATRAVKLALSRVFQNLTEILRLQAFVDVNNRASQRVLEKAGFAREGLLRKYSYLKGELKDLYLYSFLSTDTLPVD